MLATGAYLVIDQHVTPGVMIAVTLILGRALAPVEQLIANWKTIGGAKSAYERLDKALRELEKTDHLPLPKLQGEVAFERVSFGVKAGSPPILKSISFSIPPGEFLGVIGPNGSGKSTLIRILTGVWKPQSGTVRIDRADISHWDTTILGAQIGYLPQDIELFPGSVAENISRLGDIDHEEIINAARLAGAHELILALPDGYSTEIGHTGDSLSGGQRQRIALARALYRAPRLVVLDEPNANLDTDGENALVEALDRLKEMGTTVVMACHKPSLLAHASKLLVLQEGAISAFGPRDEILTRLAPVKTIRTGEQRERA
jgi:PrtD family type I secretion system ABC transporter